MHLSYKFFTDNSLFRKVRLSGDRKNAYMLCPKCGEDEFGVFLGHNHRFGCFRNVKCGWTGSINKLLVTLNIGKAAVAPYILSEGSLGYVWDEEVDHTIETGEEVSFPLWYEDKETNSNGVQLCREYMFNRLGYEIENTEWGWTLAYEDYIVFPIRDGDDLINWNARAINDNILPKYRLGYDSSSTIYGIHGDHIVDYQQHTVILVEGIFDKFSVDRWISDREMDRVSCLATMGSFINDKKINALKKKGVRKVVLWHEQDNDKMSSKFYKNLCSLMDHFEVSYSNFRDIDPGDADNKYLDVKWKSMKTSDKYFYNNLWNLI